MTQEVSSNITDVSQNIPGNADKRTNICRSNYVLLNMIYNHATYEYSYLSIPSIFTINLWSQMQIFKYFILYITIIILLSKNSQEKQIYFISPRNAILIDSQNQNHKLQKTTYEKKRHWYTHRTTHVRKNCRANSCLRWSK